MADLKKIGVKITLEGEKEYKQALKNITSEQKVLKSEMKLADAQFKATGGSIDSMRQKSKVLTEQIESQKSKIDVLKEALEKSKEQYGDNSEEANRWQIQLNNAETELVNMNSALDKNETAMAEAAKGAEDAADGVDKLGNELEETEGESKGWGSRLLSNLSFTDIVNAGKVALGAIKSAAKAVVDTVMESAKYADDVLTEAVQNNISTDDVQTFKYMSELIDTPAATIESAMTKITKSMANARDGSDKYVEAFAKIGVQYKNDDGTLRDTNDVFWEAVDALGNMEPGAERDALAMQLLGKNAKELTGLINTGREGFENYKKEAENMGVALSESQLKALGETNDAMYRLDQAVSAFKNQVSALLAPAVTEVVNLMTGVVAAAAGALSEYQSGFNATVSDMVSKLNEVDELLSNSETDYQSKVDEIDGNVATASHLADIIFELGQKTNLTEVEERRLYGALHAINELIPGLNLEYDKQTGQLSKTRAEVDKLTNAYRTQAIEQAIAAKGASIQKAYGEAYIAKVQAERELTEAIGQYGDEVYAALEERVETWAKQGLGRAESYAAAASQLMEEVQDSSHPLREFGNQLELGEAIEVLRSFGILFAEAEDKVDEADAAMMQFNEDAEKAREEMGLNVENIEAVTDATDEAKNSTEDFGDELEEEAEELTELQKQLKAYADTAGESLEDVEENFKNLADAYAEAYKAAESSITGQTGLFSELTGESEVTAEKMLSNLLGQNQVLETWTEDIEKLVAAGLDRGIIQQLVDAGPSAAQAVHDMAAQVEDENNTFIDNLNTAYRDQLDIKTAFAETMADAETGFTEYAQNLGVSSEVIADELNSRGVSAGKLYGEGLNAGLEEVEIDDNAKDIAEKAEANKDAYREAGRSAIENYTAGQKEALEESKGTIDTSLAEIDGKFTAAQESISGYGADTAKAYLDNLTAGLADETSISGLDASIDGILKLISDTVTEAETLGTDAGNGYVGKLSEALADVNNTGDIASKLSTYVLIADARIMSMTISGQNMANGLIDGLKGKLAERRSEIETAVNSIADTVNRVMRIHSPSKVMAERGGFIGEGLIEGTVNAINEGLPEISAEVGRLGDAMESGLGDLTMYDARPVAPVSNTTDVSGIRADIANLAASIADWNIVLDDGTIVGRMASGVDMQLGDAVGYKARRI